MKIRTKLRVNAIFTVVTALIIGGALLLTLRELSTLQEDGAAVNRILKEAVQMRGVILDYLLNREERMYAQWQGKQQALVKLLAAAKAKSPEEKPLLDAIRQSHESLLSIFSQLPAPGSEEGKKAKTAIHASREKESLLGGQLILKSQTMLSGALKWAELSNKKIVDAQRLPGILVIVFMVLQTAVIGVTSLSLHRSVIKPIDRLREGTAMVGSGELDHRIGLTTRDEIGELGRDFDKMTGILRSLTQERQKIEDELRTMNATLEERVAERTAILERQARDILEGANVMAASSSEILAAASQVAAGAAENATAVSQTTTTVEEVKQTALLSSQKARVVAESAQKSVEVSRDGRQAVEDLAGGMERIRERMEFVAQSIVRLSEQSQAIGVIMAAVNELAEQSNLLAVNAAIEAARAGEQGKGFTVVAQEVRRLAEQSKQATAQVRGILNDIQKATSSAVMATEQGSKAVEEGVRGSGRAGEAIGSLAGSIEEAYQAATQIAASSQQQLAGMDQVFLAMENVKQGSLLQTAASTKQAERAAQSLHELGQRMRQIVEKQKV